ncbi:hypothetical protein E3N88_11773 [Mikania micrantha]|uniref:Uncharacterized protein n=1 Tax=Mikania micrantha TaxID=192012 RepID=A0A5N6P3M5_9ASTR|nr:hypothetical protein E3N88_11773 [Mikania micrantha]
MMADDELLACGWLPRLLLKAPMVQSTLILKGMPSNVLHRGLGLISSNLGRGLTKKLGEMEKKYSENELGIFVAYRDGIRESRLTVCFAYREAFRQRTSAYRDGSTFLFFDFDDSISLVIDSQRLS